MHTTYLFGLLVFLIICSAFFSSSETSMLSLNRYRLRHLDRQGHRGARRATRLLERPDRLLGTILVGNNIVNIDDLLGQNEVDFEISRVQDFRLLNKEE